MIGAAAGWLVYTKAGQTSSSEASAPLKVTPLTTDPGVEENPALSPDGRQVAYVSDRTGDVELYVQLIGAGGPLRLTTTPGEESSPTWSPDGRFLAFLRRGTGEKVGAYMIPALGGVERKLTETYGSGVDWSPDGKTLAVVDKSAEGEPLSIF